MATQKPTLRNFYSPLLIAAGAILMVALGGNWMAAEERYEEQTTLQVFETPSVELAQLPLEELLELRDDISSYNPDPVVAKKAAEKLDKAITSKAAD